MKFRPRLRHFGLLLCLAGSLPLALARPAGAVDPESLRRKEQEQQKARSLAAELVSGILDIQLRQLEENGLHEQPIYAEIQLMRSNIDALVQAEMQEAVGLLAQAQQGTAQQRLARLTQARGKIRAVVVQLMAERQKLYRRLQVSRLAAQVRQLIQLQTETFQATRALAGLDAAEREQRALTTIEDQDDVAALYYQLVVALSDISTWGGPVGAGASAGRRILETARVEQELRSARTFLGRAGFQEAQTSQRTVVKGLQALLEQIERVRGLVSSDRQAALKLVRELLQRQQALRQLTRQSDLEDPEVQDRFSQQQQKIHRDLGSLDQTLQDVPSAEPLLEQAKAAAYQADVRLFEGNQSDALVEQGRVLGSLAEIEQQLLQAIDRDASDKSGDELAEEVKRLEQLNQALETVAQEQAKAQAEAAQQPAMAQQHQQRVSRDLVQASRQWQQDSSHRDGTIASRLADARQAAAKAEEVLQQPQQGGPEWRRQMTRNAADAIQQAHAEVKAQLADTRRRQLAVEVGELARAAEALERAAARQRDIAQATRHAAEGDALQKDVAQALLQDQQKIAEVARNIARGVQRAAPQVTQQLAQTQTSIQQVLQQLDAASQQPAATSQAAAALAHRAASQATQQLQQAAAMLRKGQGQTADALAQLADQQLEQVAQTRQEVDSELLENDQQLQHSEKMQALEQALQAVRAAQVEQQRAAGRTAAARAERLARQVASLQQQQRAADRAAEDLVRGKANTPLAAAVQQQKVAQDAGQLAASADGATAQALQEAAQAAQQAAKETLVGTPQRAESARQSAHQALVRAQQAAGSAVASAQQAAPEELDAQAQQRVGKQAVKAERLAQAATPHAQPHLKTAQTESAAAEQAIRAADEPAARRLQANSAQSLVDADQDLQAALSEAGRQRAQSLAARADQLQRLADRTATVDPNAASALRQAQQAARHEAQSHPEYHTGQTETNVQRGLQRAAANLAARQQRIRRDRDIARTVAQLALQQQQARDEIARQAEHLQQLAAAQRRDVRQAAAGRREGHLNQGTPEQIAAARSLQDARQRFANAQRATGQGATEVSGQRQVANQPIRQGLQAASQLRSADGRPPPAEGAGDARPTAPGGTQHPAPGNSPAGQATPSATDTPPSTSPTNAPLGTRLVPNSPEVTAEQIAGAAAMSAANEALAKAASDNSQTANASRARSPSTSPSQPRDANAQPGGAAAATAPSPSDGQPGPWDPATPPQSDSRTGRGGQDAQLLARQLQSEPWFAKLPPALRQAVSSRTRRPAPKGYKERLKRYFESIE